MIKENNSHSKLDLESHHFLNDKILNQVQDDKLKGFTLIEMLIVVLIIGILAAIALPQYQKSVVKSRAMHLLALQREISIAQEAYYMRNGAYPNDVEDFRIEDLDLSFKPFSFSKYSRMNSANKNPTIYDDQLEISLLGSGYIIARFRKSQYSGCGFRMNSRTGERDCLEWYYFYKGEPGSFCQQIMGAGELTDDRNNQRYYAIN